MITDSSSSNAGTGTPIFYLQIHQFYPYSTLVDPNAKVLSGKLIRSASPVVLPKQHRLHPSPWNIYLRGGKMSCHQERSMEEPSHPGGTSIKCFI